MLDFLKLRFIETVIFLFRKQENNYFSQVCVRDQIVPSRQISTICNSLLHQISLGLPVEGFSLRMSSVRLYVVVVNCRPILRNILRLTFRFSGVSDQLISPQKLKMNSGENPKVSTHCLRYEKLRLLVFRRGNNVVIWFASYYFLEFLEWESVPQNSKKLPDGKFASYGWLELVKAFVLLR